jgi:hypothetical protein
LQDVAAHCAVRVALLGLYSVFDLVQGRADCDSAAAVGEFSRFDDPDVSEIFVRVFIEFLLLEFF